MGRARIHHGQDTFLHRAPFFCFAGEYAFGFAPASVAFSLCFRLQFSIGWEGSVPWCRTDERANSMCEGSRELGHGCGRGGLATHPRAIRIVVIVVVVMVVSRMAVL